LFDVGRTRTGVAAVLQGVPISTATIEEGGQCTTQVLLAVSDNDAQKAEALKLQHGMRIPEVYPDLKDTFKICTNAWAEKLKEYVHFLSETHPTSDIPMPPITKIILCGGEAAIPGFAEWVSHEIQLPVEVADVWQHFFKYEEYIPSITRPESLRLATAAGLLLRNIHE
jgi:cell division ATPase FtsA